VSVTELHSAADFARHVSDNAAILPWGTESAGLDNSHVMVLRTLQVCSRTDGELIAESNTTTDVFHELFDRHFKAVHRYLARRVGRDRADDLASQTLPSLLPSHATAAERQIDAELSGSVRAVASENCRSCSSPVKACRVPRSAPVCASVLGPSSTTCTWFREAERNYGRSRQSPSPGGTTARLGMLVVIGGLMRGVAQNQATWEHPPWK
jgi:hypothetical protein